MLHRIAQLAIGAPRRMLAVAALVAVAAGIFGVPVAKSLCACGFEDPSSESAKAKGLLTDKFDNGDNLLFKVADAALVMELFDGPPLEFRIPKTTLGIIDVPTRTARQPAMPTAISAAPVNGAGVIASIADSLTTVDTVHCRKTMHRHKNNTPHAYGTGCK
jgi:hypothetical protein